MRTQLAPESINPPVWQRLEMANADIRLCQDFLPEPLATVLLRRLSETVAWRTDSIKMFGKTCVIPRLHQWYADDGLTYKWSGLTMQPQPWFSELTALRKKIEQTTRKSFNSVLVNLYRNGSDSMGWHADDEPELGDQPVIASLSLGAEREFVMRCRSKDALNTKNSLTLKHGSLLLMQGDTQKYWQHGLPKRLKINSPRINLTFRNIRSAVR